MSTIDELLAAAEPREPKPAGGLLERLLAAGLPLEPDAPAPDVAVAGLTEDSRRVRPGGCFVAVVGAHSDGHDHLAEAVARGAAIALVQRRIPGLAIPQVEVVDSRRALAAAACWWYGDPSRKLATIGITGTDGKTTTSFLAVAALEASGVPSGMVGTVETKIGAVREGSGEHVTTPGAPALQRALRAMADAGDRAAVVETTSHGLALARVDGIAYDAAIFTNLTHEHLELHGSFEAYRAAKVSLFERLGIAGRKVGAAGDLAPWPAVGIVNVDDPNAAFFAEGTRRAGARLITYGTERRAEVRATAVDEDARRLRVGVEAPGWRGTLELRLAGRFNVHNALAVVGLGVGMGLDPDAVAAGLAAVPGVPGRMERVDAGQPFGVIVDYAHSPASLEKVLDLLRPVAAARGGGLIVVFGSAGERDRAKRPMMGRIAGERCRVVIATDEDPRGEDRDAIVEEILAGARATAAGGVELLAIPDRRAAIAAALERARPEDVVLLAGKGHERSIIGAAGPLPWDEPAEARAGLARLGYGLPATGRPSG